MKNTKKKERDYVEIICAAYTKALKEALLEKRPGEKIVITGEVGTDDLASGYTVDIKKIK